MIHVLENLFPVFALIGAGHVLRRCNFTTAEFLNVSDRLVYFIFFPVMLFWKIGGAPLDLAADAAFYTAAILAVLTVFLLSTAFIIFAGVARYQAGSFSQGCYRFNTFIGAAVVMSAFGEEGVRRFGLLIGVLIPLINVLAVATLTWFGGRTVSRGRRRARRSGRSPRTRSSSGVPPGWSTPASSTGFRRSWTTRCAWPLT